MIKVIKFYVIEQEYFSQEKNIRVVIDVHLLLLSSHRMSVKTANPCCTLQINCMQGTHQNNKTNNKINIKIYI